MKAVHMYSLVDELGFDVFDGLLEILQGLPHSVIAELVALIVAES